MRETLERRLAELSAEIRHYPTPIARCDVQLTQLLEERSALLERLNSLEKQPGCTPDAVWVNDGGFNAA